MVFPPIFTFTNNRSGGTINVLMFEGRDSMNKMEDLLHYLNTHEQPYSPSVGEIAGAIGVSVQTTYHMLTVLKERGYIAWEPGAQRTIKVVRPT